MLKKCFYVFLLTPMMLLVGCNKGNNTPLDGFLHFACTSGEVTISCDYYGDEKYKPNLEWSSNRKTWKKVEIGTDVTDINTLKKGQTIYFRGDNPEGFNHYDCLHDEYARFILSEPQGNVELNLGGNIMSLLSPNRFMNMKHIPCGGCFQSLFSGLRVYDYPLTVDASELLLPAAELSDHVYYQLFSGACNITKAPKNLPALVAKIGCYNSMFRNCDLLTTAPIINLVNLEPSSCYYMFFDCLSLNVTKGEGKTNFFTCPDTTPVSCVEDMFRETCGGLEVDPQKGEVFYYN